nr:hypothetical protein [Rhodoblastus acidophilus]
MPKPFAALDRRVIVRISLHTGDLAAARLAAIGAERELETLWASLTGQEDRDAWARYQAALERARLEGFVYRAAPDVVAGLLPDLLARFEALADRPHDRGAREALLGMVPRPEVTLSTAFERYKELCKGENLGKREDQLRRWENARRLSIDNFLAVVGEDKRLDQITRDDARKFHRWWVDRIEAESLGRNAANKQLGQVSRILHVVGDEIGLNLGSLFSGLALDERKQRRPPIPREFVEGVLLAPGALSGLNLDARVALLLCSETGMGVEEVTSLLPSHIHLDCDVPYISIVARDGAEQKTEYRPRDLPLVASLAIALLSFVVAKWAPAYVKVLLTDDLISKAVNYGFGAVEGAVAGKTLSLSTTNLVLAAAEQYAVSSAPAISKWLGANLRPLILAKLSALGVVPADATAEATGAAVAAK